MFHFSSAYYRLFRREYLKTLVLSVLRCRLASARRLTSFGVWTRLKKTMQTMKARSGTTPSLRMRNRRSLTPPLLGSWLPPELSPRGGPAGAGIRATVVAGTLGAAAARGWRYLGRAFVAVREMRVRGMLYIRRRHCIRIDGC